MWGYWAERERGWDEEEEQGSVETAGPMVSSQCVITIVHAALAAGVCKGKAPS